MICNLTLEWLWEVLLTSEYIFLAMNQIPHMLLTFYYCYFGSKSNKLSKYLANWGHAHPPSSPSPQENLTLTLKLLLDTINCNSSSEWIQLWSSNSNSLCGTQKSTIYYQYMYALVSLFSLHELLNWKVNKHRGCY